MFTKYDKAFAAALGGWLATGGIMMFEHGLKTDVPVEVEAYLATLIIGGLTWLVPNRQA